MKKTKAFLLVLIILILSVTGCASKSSQITKVEDLKDKSVGTIVWFGVTDDVLLDMFSANYKTEFKSVKSFDSEAALIMALDTGKIEAAWLRDFQANIYAKDTEKYSMFSSEIDKAVAGSARMAAAANSDSAADMTKINEAIAQLKDDGTLDKLTKEYIDDFTFSKNYESINMPKIEGAPIYKVSIAGSMVPLDYIAADGKPTGYSIALLSKISEVAKINFELVTVGFGTDRLELTSGKIDFIFCYTLTDDNMKKDSELVFSDSYYSYSSSAMLVKK